MNYWLMKSEPSTFSIDHLAKAKRQTTGWDGVRNYQARNFMRSMKKGEQAFFYHSSCDVPGVVGIMEIVKEAYPDATAFDSKDEHYDADSDPDNPTWYAVDVKLVTKFAHPVTLDDMRAHAKGALAEMIVLKKGNRLSITPVTKAQWTFINSLARSR